MAGSSPAMTAGGRKHARPVQLTQPELVPGMAGDWQATNVAGRYRRPRLYAASASAAGA
jgi:hypothetical protein